MFRTEIPFLAHPQPLPASARVLTVGSCFSDTIGARLADAKVQAVVNPFGTTFNPLSACRLLRAAAGEEMDWQQHVVEARGRWQSYDLHAAIGAESPVDLLQQIQKLVQQTGEFLRTADVVILTLGSAFVYRLLETQELVNNCHKIPAERFEKELLTPDEVINAVAETHAHLRRQNPKLRFILTVSPVRHLKDTLPLNAVSKSVLRIACHYLSELLADVSYFPAYELLLDDLRDYRFYASDMLHPSEVAENYIWERFTKTYFDSDFGRFQKEWGSIKKALAHRPLYEGAPEHRQFLEDTLARLQRLATQVDLRKEIYEVEQRLKALPQPKIVVIPEPEEDGEERIDIGETDDIVVVAAPEEASTIEESTENSAPIEPSVQLDAKIAEAFAPTKKKRRSRGGAKRTARKKAAQLAALTSTETPLLLPVSPDDTALSLPPSDQVDDLPEQTDEEQTTVADEAPVEAEPEVISLPAALPEVEEPADVLAEEPAVDIVEPAVEEPAPAPAKPRKGRTAGQILKAKSGRKSAKASTSTTAKAAKPSVERPSRRKASAEPAPVVDVPTASPVAPPEPVPEPSSTTPAAPATKRRSRPVRKQPAKADDSTSNT